MLTYTISTVSNYPHHQASSHLFEVRRLKPSSSTAATPQHIYRTYPCVRRTREADSPRNRYCTIFYLARTLRGVKKQFAEDLPAKRNDLIDYCEQKEHVLQQPINRSKAGRGFLRQMRFFDNWETGLGTSLISPSLHGMSLTFDWALNHRNGC